MGLKPQPLGYLDPSQIDKEGLAELLVQWKVSFCCDDFWEISEKLLQHFPDCHLEQKVKAVGVGGSNGRGGRVKQKLSARGKYVSVNIGPIQVVSSEQVQAVYNAMRRDDRMKYFL
ncbi:hypothetical protein Ahy_A10g050642 isoform B [Arachis hypogaea]|uniref:Uncharacterized protein n=1 Tax=Arachis hypogaea TaxID=3818 RepID=A0A445B9Y3_ARAHY|nr:hypothetical protein Ahy_A10g050642 isoform B [Arachis hypogaea]